MILGKKTTQRINPFHDHNVETVSDRKFNTLMAILCAQQESLEFIGMMLYDLLPEDRKRKADARAEGEENTSYAE